MGIPLVAVLAFIYSAVLLPPFNPKTTRDFLHNYDYIVVGAGSGGSVVASRLSEDPCVKVLLLEAGPDANRSTEVAGLSMFSIPKDNSWWYETVPQKRAALMVKDRKLLEPLGKGFGGTSMVNGMIYIRGNKRDYDSWAENGAEGWAWKDVFPYFLKSEDNTDPEINNNGYHSRGGYLTVSTDQYSSTVKKAFIRAGEELGYQYGDRNGEKQTGVHRIQGNVRNGRRCSTSKAFLVPAQDRQNLVIVARALVTKILINDNNEAYGVKFEFENHEYEVHASKEVIVSAGAINSPQLLMLSGIGPRDHLEELGIPVIANLPVGENFRDHISTPNVQLEVTRAESYLKRLYSNISESISEYNKFGTGIYSTLCGIEGIAFINSKYNDPSLDWPDIGLYLSSLFTTPFTIQESTISKEMDTLEGILNSEKIFLSMAASILRPKSQGTVRLSSTNPKDAPLIDVNVFDVEEDHLILVEAIKESIKLLTQTRAFQEVGTTIVKENSPGCENYEATSIEYARCLAINYTNVIGHVGGTCKMGSPFDGTAVVDPRLRVIGVKNLRVADASIMPTLVSGNLNAPVIMIGEKASDLIKEDNLDRLECI